MVINAVPEFGEFFVFEKICCNVVDKKEVGKEHFYEKQYQLRGKKKELNRNIHCVVVLS